MPPGEHDHVQLPAGAIEQRVDVIGGGHHLDRAAMEQRRQATALDLVGDDPDRRGDSHNRSGGCGANR
jgi:hypothetical protein